MVISIVIGALGTMPYGLVKGPKYLEIRGHVVTIKIARSARILRGILEL